MEPRFDDQPNTLRRVTGRTQMHATHTLSLCVSLFHSQGERSSCVSQEASGMYSMGLLRFKIIIQFGSLTRNSSHLTATNGTKFSLIFFHSSLFLLTQVPCYK